MMKGIITVMMLLGLVTNEVDQEPDLNALLFKNENPCTTSLPVNKAISPFEELIKAILNAKDIREVVCTHFCSDNLLTDEKGDTSVYMSDYTDLYYGNVNGAVSAFENIVKQGTAKGWKTGPWRDFVKAGRVFGLDRKANKIRMFVWNGCAHPKTLLSVFEAMQKVSTYDNVLLFRCGGQHMEFGRNQK